MVGEPSHVKQLSLNHVCKIGLSSSSEVSYKSKVKGKSKRVSANVLNEF
jgi:hypothetical protein